MNKTPGATEALLESWKPRRILAACIVFSMLVSIAPLASAHFTNSYGSQTSAAASPDGAENCRYGGDASTSAFSLAAAYARYANTIPPGSGPNPDDGLGPCASWTNGDAGVSGTYVAGAGAAAPSGILPVASPTVELFPLGASAAAQVANCDLEVASGGIPGSPVDETNVAGTFNPGGLVPDGTWDDGGDGGACHAQYTDPLTGDPVPAYSSPGCSGYAHASDKVLGGEVFIATQCDYEHPVSIGNDLVGTAVSAAFCAINVPTGGCDLGSLESSLGSILPSAYDCGGDGVADDAFYGEGGGEAPAPGIQYPTQTDCPSGDETASVLVLNAVDSQGNLTLDPQTPVVESHLPVSSGWIDWSPTCSYGVDLSNDGNNRTDGQSTCAVAPPLSHEPVMCIISLSTNSNDVSVDQPVPSINCVSPRGAHVLCWTRYVAPFSSTDDDNAGSAGDVNVTCRVRHGCEAKTAWVTAALHTAIPSGEVETELHCGTVFIAQAEANNSAPLGVSQGMKTRGSYFCSVEFTVESSFTPHVYSATGMCSDVPPPIF